MKIKNSLFSIISIKKNCVEIRKIKGKISYKRLGEFKKESTKGKKILASAFSKKFISSNKFVISTNEKKIEVRN